MGITSNWIRYGENKEYIGYLSKPSNVSEPLSCIVVIQEIWGVDEHIQNVTDRFAEAGYVAIAPDLYAESGERPESLRADRVQNVKLFLDSLPRSVWFDAAGREEALSQRPEAERKQLEETFSTVFGGLKPAEYLDKLVKTTGFFRENHPDTKGKDMASVGFCMGGALSAQLASLDPLLKGAIVFYGQSPNVEQIANIECPVIGFYGENDPNITSGVSGFADSMKQSGKRYEYHIYEGASHAFFNDTRSSYHVLAARDAFVKSLEFFHEILS